MSETPMTDKAWAAYQDDAHSEDGDPWKLASELERAHAKCKRENAAMRKACLKCKHHIRKESVAHL
jgi:hypothetical protein